MYLWKIKKGARNILTKNLCAVKIPSEQKKITKSWEFIYTTNQLEKLLKEVKRRFVLPDEENAAKILSLIYYELNKWISKRKL